MALQIREKTDSYVKCFLCSAEVSTADAIPQYVLSVAKDASFFYALRLLCWFCTYPVDAPLPVHACLVPLISTISEIPEDCCRRKGRLKKT